MLDKKLFKALRAGGLGHKVAVDLADPTGPYFLGRTTEASEDGQYLNIDIGDGAWTHNIGSPADDQLWTPPVMCPLVANSVLTVTHNLQSGSGFSYPDLSILRLTLVKMADANGTPVDQVTTMLSGSRAGGVVTRPASVSGFAVSATSSAARGYKVTVATAGHYQVWAYSNRMDS